MFVHRRGRIRTDRNGAGGPGRREVAAKNNELRIEVENQGQQTMIGAVDIGGTKLAVGLVDDGGRVLAKRETATGPESTYSAGLDTIAGMFREMATAARVKITGIGIGSTGPVDPLSGELGDVDFLTHWRRQNPVRDLA